MDNRTRVRAVRFPAILVFAFLALVAMSARDGVARAVTQTLPAGTHQGFRSTSAFDNFPAPAYDSGWVNMATNSAKTLTHNLGGNVADYLVDMQYKMSDSNGVNVRYFGGADFGTHPPGGTSADDRVGAYWRSLTNSSITIYRRPEDIYAPQIRIRIWRKPSPSYDSGWVTMATNSAKTLTHNVGGNPEDYLVDMEYKTSDANGVNVRYFGGADFGTHPPGGTSTDDRVGAYWRSLTNATITIYRRPEDIYAPQIRIRLWKVPAHQILLPTVLEH